MKTINPASNHILNTYNEMTSQEVAQAVELADHQFLAWKALSFEERGSLFYKVADVLEERKGELAELMSEEMGKLKSEAIGEVEKCAWVCRYYAEHASGFLADEAIKTDFSKSFVTYQPLGVVLAVMPWNFPLWQVFRFAAPTLMAGNTAVLKHATSVSGCALEIARLFKDAGFPEGVFQTLLIGSDKVENVIAHPKIRAVTLTGSVGAGRAVAAKAGEYLKKTVLELGGSDAYIVLEDADIETAAEICATSRLLNCGQSCIAAKRFIVVDAVYDRFLEAFKSELLSREIGPMSSVKARDELHEQVKKCIDMGAQCHFGGDIPDREGAWYPITFLSDITPGMPAYDDELFGPVASVIKASDEADAIRISNSSVFGLGGAVFTRDISKGLKIARDELDTGAVAVNDFVKSDPRLPFGGVKDSGYGRELGAFGIKEFVNIKTVTAK